MTRITPQQAVFLSFIHGIGYSKLLDIFYWVNIEFPSETSFYDIQKSLCQDFLDLAEESCKKYRSQSHKGVGFDGSWSQKRNAPHCIVEAISMDTHKIVDFQMVTQYDFPIENIHVTVDKTIASKAMEGLGLEKIAYRDSFQQNTDYYVHDGDLAAEVIILNTGLDLQQVFDPNHFIPTILNKYDKSGQTSLLSSISTRLIKRFKRIFHDDSIPDEAKKEAWKQSYDHYVSDDDWDQRANPDAQRALQKFLFDSSIAFDFMKPHITTNINESFHALKAEFAPKSVCWKYSFVLRMCVAIVAFNEGPSWKQLLAAKLNVSLPTKLRCIQGIKEYEKRSAKLKSIRAKPDYPRQRAIQRKKHRERQLSTKNYEVHKEREDDDPSDQLTYYNVKKRDIWPRISEISGQWKTKTFFAKGKIHLIDEYLRKINPLASRKVLIDNDTCCLLFTFGSRLKSLTATCMKTKGINLVKVSDKNIEEIVKICGPDKAETYIQKEDPIVVGETIQTIITAMKSQSQSQKVIDSSSSESESDDESDSFSSMDEIIDESDHGGLINVTNTCYANVAVQLFARVDPLCEIVASLEDDNCKDPIIIELNKICANLRSNKNENVIDLCHYLGFEPFTMSEPEVFIERLLSHIVNQYSIEVIKPLLLDEQNWRIIICNKSSFISSIESFFIKFIPDILFVSCPREQRDKAKFNYPESFNLNKRITYNLIAVIFKEPSHFTIAIKIQNKFYLYDDVKKPKAIKNICSITYQTKNIMNIYLKTLSESGNIYN